MLFDGGRSEYLISAGWSQVFLVSFHWNVTVVSRPLALNVCKLLECDNLALRPGASLKECEHRPLAANWWWSLAARSGLTFSLLWSLSSRTCNDKRRGGFGERRHQAGAPEHNALAGQIDADRWHCIHGQQPQSDSQRGARHRGPDPEDHRLLRLQPRLLQPQKWVKGQKYRIMRGCDSHVWQVWGTTFSLTNRQEIKWIRDKRRKNVRSLF